MQTGDTNALATAGAGVGDPGSEPVESLIARVARPLALVALVVIAYHYSLRTLLDGIELDTPLAYVALVPVVALLMALAKGYGPYAIDIHDRQVDYIIGVPLVAAAVGANLVFPTRVSSMFWVWRIDLLTLPFFVAGAVALIFGTRTLWRVRGAILFLFLAWPLPYVFAIDRGLGNFTNVTLSVLKASVRAIPIASAVPGGDGSLFTIPHASGSVVLSVASACSGANGLVGFFLVAVGAQSVIKGPRKRRALWLGVGAGLVWLSNLLRIFLIFLAARFLGQDVALNWIHPFLGLALFCGAILAMVLALPRFGLRFARPGGGSPDGGGPPHPERPRAPKYRPRARVALVTLLLIAAGLGVLNRNLQDAQAVASSLGAARLSSFGIGQGTPTGWERTYIEGFDWARRYFGQDSAWLRYIYLQKPKKSGVLVSPQPVIADIITTTRLSALSFYGIEACYSFHGFRVSHSKSVDLGDGVVGGILTWVSRDGVSRTTLYWQWPIRRNHKTVYERVTLIMNDPVAGSRVSSPAVPSELSREFQVRIADAIQGRGGSGGPKLTPIQVAARKFLVAFARDMVAQRAVAKQQASP